MLQVKLLHVFLMNDFNLFHRLTFVFSRPRSPQRNAPFCAGTTTITPPQSACGCKVVNALDIVRITLIRARCGAGALRTLHLRVTSSAGPTQSRRACRKAELTRWLALQDNMGMWMAQGQPHSSRNLQELLSQRIERCTSPTQATTSFVRCVARCRVFIY